jgi:hypothetical protein
MVGDARIPPSFVVEPGAVHPFAALPLRTIALDGVCSGPHIDPAAERYSFDHHAGCLRLVTSATRQQVLDAVVLGLDPTGHRVLLNDVDGDSVLAAWILSRAADLRFPGALARIRPLVWAVGGMDAHGPAWPVPHAELARRYRRLLDGLLDDEATPPAERLRASLERLDAWWAARLAPVGEDAPDDGAENMPGMRICARGAWSLADLRAVEPSWRGRAAIALYRRGIDRYVTWAPIDARLHRYGIGKRSDLVAGFPLPEIYDALNAEEGKLLAGVGMSEPPGDGWGGSSSIGGSPRGGSLLGPERVGAVIDAVVARSSTVAAGTGASRPQRSQS